MWTFIPHLFLRTCATVLAFLEKRKDCGTTSSQSEQHEKTSQNYVTTEEGKTDTSVTSGTTRTCAQESGSQSDKSSCFSKKSTQERPPQLSKYLLFSPLLFSSFHFLPSSFFSLASAALFMLFLSHLPLATCARRFLHAYPYIL